MIHDRHIDQPGVICFCPDCIVHRQAERPAIAELEANMKSIKAERLEIADRLPEFWNWTPVD